MSDQLFSPATLARKKQPAVADISMLFDNSVCRVKTNRLVLLREKYVVCCGNCGEQIVLCVVGTDSVVCCGNCREQIFLCVVGIVGTR